MQDQQQQQQGWCEKFAEFCVAAAAFAQKCRLGFAQSARGSTTTASGDWSENQLGKSKEPLPVVSPKSCSTQGVNS